MTRLDLATQLIAAHISSGARYFAGPGLAQQMVLEPDVPDSTRAVLVNSAFALADLMLAQNEKAFREKYEAAPKCTRCAYPESHHGLLKVYACKDFTLASPKEKK